MTSRVLSPLFAWSSDGKLTNWAGNVAYSTEKQYSANSLKEIQEFVRTRSSLKVLGTRHCFNKIADSTREFLSVKAMDHVVGLDPDARTVTIESGMTYGQLCPYLDSQGWALHNLASLPHISVAGACSTATHGSGEKNGNLSTAVSALEMINAAGEVIKVSRSRDGEMFRGAVVGLGALGVITKVTLDVQPRFMMKQYVYENLPLSELREHFDVIESAAYSVSLFTDWQEKRINEVWLKLRMPHEPKFDAPVEFFWGETGHPQSSPDYCSFGGKLYRADGCPGSLVRATTSLPDGLYAERRQGTSVRVLCAAPECSRCDPCRRAPARSSGATSSDFRNSNHCRRRPLDESLPQTAERIDSFHLEAKLASSENSAAGDRKRAESISCPPPLGEAFHHLS